MCLGGEGVHKSRRAELFFRTPLRLLLAGTKLVIFIFICLSFRGIICGLVTFL